MTALKVSGHRRICFLLLALLHCLALTAIMSRRLLAQSSLPASANPSAQPAASANPPKETPVFHADTRLVVIDVVVTDKQGHPVTGLARENFTLKENGKPQILKAFEAHLPPAQPLPISTVKLAPNLYSNVPMQPLESSISIVLFDLVNTPLTDQSYAREQMVQFLKTLPPGQRVALFVLGSRLRMLSGFTTDSSQLVALAKKLIPHSSELLTTEEDKQRSEDQITEMAQGSPNPGFFDAMRDFLADEEQFRTTARVETTLSALNALARGVSGYSGRKNLLWLSEGFPVYFGPDADATNPFVNARSYESLLRETSGLLSSAQMAVYPIDIGGLKTGGVAIGSSGLGASGFRNGRSRYGTLINRQGMAMEAAHSAMDEIAKDTGGKAFYNTNDLKSAMVRSVERGTSYYTLAYTPENRNWDSSFRHVEVKLDQSGLKTDYRRGYFATPIQNFDKEAAQRMVAAMQPGMPDSTMILFGARVLPMQPDEPSATLTYVVSAQQIAFTETPDQRRHARIEMVAVAWDKKGEPAGTASQTIELAVKPETYQTELREGIRAQMKLLLKPGDYSLRLGLMDDATGKIGSLQVPFQVPVPVPPAK